MTSVWSGKSISPGSFLLSRRWSRQELDLRRLNRLVTALFIAGLLLTFPPFMDLLQGK